MMVPRFSAAQRAAVELRSERRLAITFLGWTALLAVVADLVLLMAGHDPPGGLLAVAGGCVGALATLVTSGGPGPDAARAASKVRPGDGRVGL